jgi:hypothetical protein
VVPFGPDSLAAMSNSTAEEVNTRVGFKAHRAPDCMVLKTADMCPVWSRPSFQVSSPRLTSDIDVGMTTNQTKMQQWYLRALPN